MAVPGLLTVCAIIDANVAGEVFGTQRSEAGTRFLKWLNTGKGVLVVGGRVFEELGQSERFRKWAMTARLAGRLRSENGAAVAARANKIENKGACVSDDPHVLALAQISGARLLYSNDRDLQRDFKDKALIYNPPGKVYSTLRSQRLTRAHKQLLADRALCRR